MKIRLLLFLLLFFIGSFLFRKTSGQTAAWTIMIYLDGDNDLEGPAIEDFNEMEVVGSDTSVNIIVQFDRIIGNVTSDGDWTDTRRFRILQDTSENIMSSPAVEIMGELNMGDPEVLTDFISWSAAEYPAEHYALILWDHGTGWLKSDQCRQRIPLPDKQVCSDLTDGDFLSNIEVGLAIDESGIHLDIVGYDACLMGMIEVAYQIKDLADVMVASEEIVPLDGYDYTAFLAALTADPGMSAEDLAGFMVTAYGDFYEDYVTLSAIDLSHIRNIGTQLDSLTTEIVDDGSAWETVGLAWLETHRFYNSAYLDLGDFAYNLSEIADNENIRQKSADLFDTIQSAVTANFAGLSNPDVTGLSIYFPTISFPSEYEAEGRDFSDSTRWVDFLHAFLLNYFPDYWEPNNHLANAGIVDLRYDITTGRLTSMSDIDIYRVFYPSDGYGTEYIELIPPSNVDMYLYSVEDTLIEKIDSSKNSGTNAERIYFTGRDTGYYYILLKPVEPSNELYEFSFYGNFYSLDQVYETSAIHAFDDGQPDDEYYTSSADEGIGMSFMDYGILKGVWYYITDLDADGGENEPTLTLKLYSYEYSRDVEGYVPVVVHPDRTGWNYIDISDQQLYFTMEKTIVGFIWDGIGAPALGIDTVSSDYSTFSFVSGNWTPIHEDVLIFIRPVFYLPSQGPRSCYCNELTELTSKSGSFSDGSGVYYYSNNCHCSWLIQPEGATPITLTVEELDIEPDFDFLYVYDGDDTSDTLAALSGSLSDISISSTGSSMLVEFITNNSVIYKGWKAKYTSENPSDIRDIASSADDWKLYPNPGNGIIHLGVDTESSFETSIDIYNAIGQIVEKQKFSSNENEILIDISDQPQGLYYIKLTNSIESVVYKYSLK